jgi:ribosomal protein S18 acetylase RimI-like enzyme
MTTLTVKTAKASDETSIIDTIVLALSPDPFMRWLYPDPHNYLRHFPRLIRTFGGKAFEHTGAYYMDGYSGAELWLLPNVYQDVEALITLLKHTVSEQDLETVMAILNQMERFHPKEPHWYLSFLGVDPVKQNYGFGSALLNHALLQCDQDSKLAYVESSNSRNLPFYERHGFEVMGTIQAGTSPPLFPMCRKPR